MYNKQSAAPMSFMGGSTRIQFDQTAHHPLQQTVSTGAAGGAGPERQQAEGRAHHHPQLPAVAHAGRPFQLHQHLPRGPTAARDQGESAETTSTSSGNHQEIGFKW